MKRLFFGIIFIVLIMATPRTPEAKVTGECFSCHTMHNSQAGQAMAFGDDRSTPRSDPYATLLLYSCLGCHSNVSNGDTVVNNTPIVYNSLGPDTPLAGGNFHYIAPIDDDNTGHNVAAIDEEENGSMFPPPGYETDPGITAANFTCAGAYGCHGDRTITGNIESIKGAHHAGVSGVCDGSDLPNSYRFLKGVKGHENMDATKPWQNATAIIHNEYYGVSGTGTESTESTPGENTISGLCAECHGDFHGPGEAGEDIGTASPWLRHPTDVVLKNSGEYALYTTYSTVSPVARPTVYSIINTPGTNDLVAPGTDIIMCLSCHGAHATANYKLMRWDYTSSTLLTALSGCIVCHTSKS